MAQQAVWVGELLECAGCAVWEVRPGDVDGWLAGARRRGVAGGTVLLMAQAVYRFYVFVQARYGRVVEEVSGRAVVQPVDEFNRPRRVVTMVRVPPSAGEVEALFEAWRRSLPSAGAGFLPAARDYVAASLWRRVGLRISESARLEVGDWYPQMGAHGVLHVRWGKGARGSGPRQRLVPAIDGVDRLLAWWLGQVRPQFGDDVAGGRAVLLPSRLHTPGAGRRSACAATLRQGLAGEVARWLPDWSGRLTPHVLRHFCASWLYGRGVGLSAVQALLGHVWVSTTAAYVHVPAERIEEQWAQANARVGVRLLGAAAGGSGWTGGGAGAVGVAVEGG
ncbi:tyrosine-type recombinase/integrase [Streptomyces sp. NPDC008141]|uniref:tyrosine-type recombinase/integrase n=1 Tax=Streptomyces sp. NPDC008141 TaxID=3364815 RepID=UPI0036EFB8EB